MAKIIDAMYHYKPPWSGVGAHCHLRIYEKGNRTVVLWSEQPDNRGMSVTNYASELATMIVQRYGLVHSQTTFIEHYPAEMGEGASRGESYDLVMFDWQEVDVVFNRVLWTQIAGAGVRWVANNPRWRRLAMEEVEQMTGAQRV